tara:strand:+ start:275 stop:478 length:204 start_codon:yes stop_codon:yes gene_type:complete
MKRFQEFTYILFIFIGACLLLGLPLQFLWNVCLVGAIDGFNPIGFWQAIGITLLASILFKNWNNQIK